MSIVPTGNFHAGEIFDGFRQAFGERNAAAADSDQGEVFGAAAFFDDFMGQTVKRAADFFRGEELSFFYDAHLAHHPSIDGGKFAATESRQNSDATDSSF